MSSIHRVIRLGVALCVAVLLSACGTPMGLTKQTAQLDLSKKSIVLASFEITRSNGRLMPDPRYVLLGDQQVVEDKRKLSLAIDDEGMEQQTDKPRKLVLIRMSLEPGKHNIQHVMGTITGFLAAGTWVVPLAADFEVPPQSVVYLGRISAHLRDRKDNEFRAGSLIPLIDQAALGISNATFDVTLSDQSTTDLPRFKQEFAALRTQTIQTQLLPAYDRSVFDRAFMGDVSTSAPSRAGAKSN